MRYKTILIFGAPGSGKGTQGVALGKIPGFYHCACGDVFRSLDTRTELGKKFLEYSSKGLLVPDEVTVELWKVTIESNVNAHLFAPKEDYLVLDGIPRNVEQAKIMSGLIDVVHVFHLSCPDREQLVERLKKRALKDNRLDDANEEVIRNRLLTYEKESKPVLDYYGDELVSLIDAAQRPVKVMHDLLSKILHFNGFGEQES